MERIPWPAVASSERMLTVHATPAGSTEIFSTSCAQFAPLPSESPPLDTPHRTIRDSATPTHKGVNGNSPPHRRVHRAHRRMPAKTHEHELAEQDELPWRTDVPL
jgi:hypothetical protein